MTELESRVRDALLDQGAADARTDQMTDRIIIRLEHSARRRRAAKSLTAALALVVAVTTAFLVRGGGDVVTSVPAVPSAIDSGDKTGSPSLDAPEATMVNEVAAYRSGQQKWAECLRRSGVPVSGPDSHGDVWVNPDPALQRKADDCRHLRPILTNAVEQALQTALPGTSVETPLSEPVTLTRTGSGAVEIGPAPAGATGVSTELSCLSAGSFSWPNGASVQCTQADATDPDQLAHPGRYTLALPTGSTTVTITAPDDGRWRLTVHWVKVSYVPYAVNENGQTYGSTGENGTGAQPDLVAVRADNGRGGYVYLNQLDGSTPASPADALRQQANASGGRDLPVYESDGHTRIGTFHSG